MAVSEQISQPHKILYITGNDPNTGAPHHIMPALWLAREGYEVLAICRGDRFELTFKTVLSQLRTRRLIVRGKGILSAIRWQFNLFVEIIRQRFNRRVSCYYVEGSLATPAALLALCFLPAYRVIYHTQDYLEPGRHRIWEYFERRFAKRAGPVICNEPNRSRFMASYYRLASVPHVVRTSLPQSWPIPIRDTKIRSDLIARIKKPDNGKIRLVINQSPLSDVRCSAQLLKAFKYLPDNYILIVTGMGETEDDMGSWEKTVVAYGLEQRIIAVKRMPYNSLLKYTAACDIGILLYPNDGIGNYYQAPGRLTEYISCGLPVVASNFPSLELMVMKYKIGAVADPDIPMEITNAIRKLGEVSDEELQLDRDRLRKLAKGPLAFDKQAKVIQDIIQEANGRDRLVT